MEEGSCFVRMGSEKGSHEGMEREEVELSRVEVPERRGRGDVDRCLSESQKVPGSELQLINARGKPGLLDS